MPLTEGSKAPKFNLACDGDTRAKLSDYAGKKLVLYFYPKDDTPGCTTEALDFTAQIKNFDKANTSILGVSADTVAKHEKFKNKHNLKILLGSDEDHEVLNAYEVWVEKNMYGKKYMGIERATFLIDENGKIQKIWRKVKVKNHVAEVLEAAKTV